MQGTRMWMAVARRGRNGRSIRLLFAALVVALASGEPATAQDGSAIAPHKRTRLEQYLLSVDAHRLVDAERGRVLFLDVRTEQEVENGTPVSIDGNVPFVRSAAPAEAGGRPKVVPNLDFVASVEAKLAAKSLTKADPVILICRTGNRSARAVDALAAAGFSRVYNVVDGFEGDRAGTGWRLSRLPWFYPRDPQRTYIGAASN